ncbi:PorP/SprF family type IX secretion system membrane protein [Maribacter sp. IgM3_T14_3]|uniref:PorP/SprF family type IX secretion system membrane protein n=1 Tax=Maribacter sp. IgM3_T14_3 TaxID=3415140 RepID=UPI003C7031EA
MKNIKLTMAIMLVTGLGLHAQQDAQYTQYMYNTMTVNPAYTGSRGMLSIAALHRSQWVGLDGAPATQTLNVHSPVGGRMGLGLSIVNDNLGNGTSQETNFDVATSYTIPTSEKGQLSFGLKLGGNLLNVDLNRLAAYRPDLNRTGQDGVSNNFSFNFGAGIYYHTDRFYLGLSAPNFLGTQHFEDSENAETFLAEERLNTYLISGYVFDLSPNVKFKPATLVKMVSGAPLQVDVSANFMFNEKFILGAAYRWDAALSGLIGFNVSDQFMVGLAYDREITELGATTFNSGSFEVFLRYELLSKTRKLKTARFF